MIRVSPSNNIYPSVSGLAPLHDNSYLAVHDVKSDDGEGRLSRYNPDTSLLEDVRVDWSATGAANDLEGISRIPGSQDYLAVEGSRWGGRTPQLYTLTYQNGEAVSKAKTPLPKFPHEIEGVATQPLPDGKQMLLLAGRGDDDPGRLHWGIYDPSTNDVAWEISGLEGIPVNTPRVLGVGQRTLSDIAITPQGDVWAAAARDEGDDGPFESLIYRVGHLTGNSSQPVVLTMDEPHYVPNSKVEALTVNQTREGSLFFGSDNENFGGNLNATIFEM